MTQHPDWLQVVLNSTDATSIPDGGTWMAELLVGIAHRYTAGA